MKKFKVWYKNGDYKEVKVENVEELESNPTIIAIEEIVCEIV